jgi:hypothetical protein
MPLGTITYVKCLDSRGVGSQWTSMHDLQHEPCRCDSVGWLIYEDDEVIELAPHRTDIEHGDEMQVCGEMVIPRVCILERRLVQPVSEGA